MNPRKGTETLDSDDLTPAGFWRQAFGLMNPRKGTETSRIRARAKSGMPPFGLMNPRKGTETGDAGTQARGKGGLSA